MSGQSLPSAAPNPTDSYTFRTITQDYFTYALNIDTTTWETWTAAVDDTVTYNVVAGAETNRNMFSEFIM